METAQEQTDTISADEAIVSGQVSPATETVTTATPEPEEPADNVTGFGLVIEQFENHTRGPKVPEHILTIHIDEVHKEIAQEWTRIAARYTETRNNVEDRWAFKDKYLLYAITQKCLTEDQSYKPPITAEMQRKLTQEVVVRYAEIYSTLQSSNPVELRTKDIYEAQSKVQSGIWARTKRQYDRAVNSEGNITRDFFGKLTGKTQKLDKPVFDTHYGHVHRTKPALSLEINLLETGYQDYMLSSMVLKDVDSIARALEANATELQHVLSLATEFKRAKNDNRIKAARQLLDYIQQNNHGRPKISETHIDELIQITDMITRALEHDTAYEEWKNTILPQQAPQRPQQATAPQQVEYNPDNHVDNRVEFIRGLLQLPPEQRQAVIDKRIEIYFNELNNRNPRPTNIEELIQEERLALERAVTNIRTEPASTPQETAQEEEEVEMEDSFIKVARDAIYKHMTGKGAQTREQLATDLENLLKAMHRHRNLTPAQLAQLQENLDIFIELHVPEKHITLQTTDITVEELMLLLEGDVNRIKLLLKKTADPQRKESLISDYEVLAGAIWVEEESVAAQQQTTLQKPNEPEIETYEAELVEDTDADNAETEEPAESLEAEVVPLDNTDWQGAVKTALDDYSPAVDDSNKIITNLLGRYVQEVARNPGITTDEINNAVASEARRLEDLFTQKLERSVT